MEMLHQSDEIIAKRYRIIDQLGQGGSGITYASQDLQTDETIALKSLSLSQLDNWKKLELFEREAQKLQQLDHPCIPKYLDYFQVETEADIIFYIVQELAPGKTLTTLIEEGWKPDETTVKQIAKQILEILIYLQSLIPPVIHRDIKPQNLIYSPSQDDNKTIGKLFLVDFGAVQDTYQNTVGSTVAGTYGYMAPEQFRGQAVLSSDLYGLGATLLFILTSQHPSQFPEKKFKIDFRPYCKISQEFADWIDKLIDPNKEYRFPDAQAALDVLENRKSLNDYLNLHQIKPAYTSVKITKNEDKLVIDIPSAFLRNRYNYSLIFLITVWYLGLGLILYGISASISSGIAVGCVWIYIISLILEIFVSKTNAVTVFLLQIFLLILISRSALIVSSSLWYILLIDLTLGKILRVNIIKDMLFKISIEITAQNLQFRRYFLNFRVEFSQYNKDEKIINKSSKFTPITVVFKAFNPKIKSFRLKIDDYDRKKLQFGRFLTLAEKSWLVEEIKNFGGFVLCEDFCKRFFRQ